jgi:hypothetical protein
MSEPKILNKLFRNSLGYIVAIGAVALATWLKFLAEPSIIPANVPILYILAIVPTAVYFGLGPSLTVCVLSFLAYDYYFIPPLHQISYNNIDGPILAIFLLVGVLFSLLASNLRQKNMFKNRGIYGVACSLSQIAPESIYPFPNHWYLAILPIFLFERAISNRTFFAQSYFHRSLPILIIASILGVSTFCNGSDETGHYAANIRINAKFRNI